MREVLHQSFKEGPFTIETEIHLDSGNWLNSYFEVKVFAKIPVVGEVKIIDARIDKDHPKVDVSVHGVGATVVLDIEKKELYADLHALGHHYHVTIYKF